MLISFILFSNEGPKGLLQVATKYNTLHIHSYLHIHITHIYTYAYTHVIAISNRGAENIISSLSKI